MADYYQVKNQNIFNPPANTSLGNATNQFDDVYIQNDLVLGNTTVTGATIVTPKVSTITYPGDDTAADPAGGQTITLTGSGFLAGASVLINGSAVGVVSVVSSTTITFTSPANATGSYVLYVINTDGGTAIAIPGIQYSGTPNWTTAAGSLGNVYETASFNQSVTATGDVPITYSLFSGSIPPGATFNSNGTITGTSQLLSSPTTYTFTVRATDAELQDTNRSFSLTINPDVVTWASPANGTTYTSTTNSAISNVTLSATSAVGSGITYTANALPTGLSLTGANISGTPTVEANSSSLLTATANTTSELSSITINWVIGVSNDIFFEYNTLLIPGASTTFVDDASTNNFAVTINGDTKPNNFNPYTPGYYSNYFDGSGDYLSTSAGASAFDFSSTKTLTFECWFSASTLSGNHTLLSINECQPFRFIVTSSTLLWQATGSGTTILSTSQTWAIGAWYHIACVRDNDTLYMFVNGAQVATASYSTSWGATSTSYPVAVGANRTDTFYFNGNISNLRLVKGTALYTSSFTPSTTPLTAVSGTSLLTCQSNRFIDNSTNNLTLAVAGNTSISSFDPFVPNSSYSTYGSGYFDGTGDYLNTPSSAALTASGNFTIEAWVYVTASSLSAGFVSTQGSSTSGMFIGTFQGTLQFRLGTDGAAFDIYDSVALTTNVWIHVAGVRSGNTLTLYKNGVSVGSIGSVNNTAVNTVAVMGRYYTDYNGFYANGYISDARLVVGTAVYTANFTPPTAPLTAISGTSLLTLQNNQSVNNNVFLDNSTNNFPVTYVGKATQGTFSPYGGNWSNYFDGTGDYLTTPITASGPLDLGSGSWTVEAWVMYTGSSLTSGYRNFLTFCNNSGYPYLQFGTKTGTGYVFAEEGTQSSVPWSVAGTTLLTSNVWHHIATVRNGNNIYLYLDGVLQGSVAYSGTIQTFAKVQIGSLTYNGSVIQDWTGYISNARIVKGTAVYTSAFTPSTTPLTPITNTSLLTCADSRFIDDSINNYTITKVGDTSVQRFSPFNPSSLTPTSYSGYFDGTGDVLNITGAAGPEGTQDFTWESWWYFTNLGGQYPRIFEANTASGFQIYSDSGTFGVASNGGAIIVSYNISALTNQWLHLCVTRSGSAMRLFVNGVLRAYSALGGTNFASSTAWRVFSEGGGPIGYLSNMRVVRGSVVAGYVTASTTTGTTIFTPPTSPLTAISGTSLLTCQSPTFIDNSTNNFPITTAGNSQPTIQNPFGFTSATTQGYTVSTIGGSTNSDNTGIIYSNIASPIAGTTTNWTMEAWVYFNSFGSSNWIFGLGNNTGGNTPYVELRVSSNTTVRFAESSTVTTIWAIETAYTFTASQWYHFAATRSGNTIRLFINGVQIGSTTYGSAIQSGLKPFTQGILFGGGGARSDGVNGYITDTRMIAGTALYTSNFVPPSQPLTAIQNTSWLINGTSAGVYDAAMMTTMETIDGAKLSTAVSKFGGSSMSFDGTNDQIQTPIIQPFGTGNLTIEFWIYPLDTASRYIFSFGEGWSPADGVSLIQYNGNYAFTCGSAGGANAGQAVEINGWHHIAIVRNGTAVNFYYDGISKSSGTDSTNLTASKLDIGYAFTGGSWGPFYGYMDDFRITKGYARYTANFTPPTTAFPIY